MAVVERLAAGIVVSMVGTWSTDTLPVVLLVDTFPVVLVILMVDSSEILPTESSALLPIDSPSIVVSPFECKKKRGLLANNEKACSRFTQTTDHTPFGDKPARDHHRLQIAVGRVDVVRGKKRTNSYENGVISFLGRKGVVDEFFPDLEVSLFPMEQEMGKLSVSKMSPEEKFDLITRNLQEVLGGDAMKVRGSRRRDTSRDILPSPLNE